MWLYKHLLRMCLLSFSLGALDFEKIRWCGSGLNPLDKAKATRTVTEMFFSCKNDIIRQNVKPSIIHEADRLCAAWRVCYVIGADNKNASLTFGEVTVNCMRTMARTWVTVSPRCAGRFLPKDVRHILEAVKWMKDFISG
ncbi:uncharacterized protein LOC142574212 isoform X2 [Dermacentor variabilis]|uniref:uncharacterized protein LOC142574212 isoform X2 n=1 Tax=Dermacentor variabilis TaxID=34621 RepID=UPI003F5AE176